MKRINKETNYKYAIDFLLVDLISLKITQLMDITMFRTEMDNLQIILSNYVYLLISLE